MKRNGTTVEDLRKVKLFLNPELAAHAGWIPKGVKKQTVVNIIDEDGESIGELELGSDGFVKVVINNDRKAVISRIEYIPGRNHAKVVYDRVTER